MFLQDFDGHKIDMVFRSMRIIYQNDVPFILNVEMYAFLQITTLQVFKYMITTLDINFGMKSRT